MIRRRVSMLVQLEMMVRSNRLSIGKLLARLRRLISQTWPIIPKIWITSRDPNQPSMTRRNRSGFWTSRRVWRRQRRGARRIGLMQLHRISRRNRERRIFHWVSNKWKDCGIGAFLASTSKDSLMIRVRPQDKEGSHYIYRPSRWSEMIQATFEIRAIQRICL